MKTYRIAICPQCGDGPLVFDPDGIDAYEGMAPRATYKNGHVILEPSFPNSSSGMPVAKVIEVVRRLALCTCGTPTAASCPIHINP